MSGKLEFWVEDEGSYKYTPKMKLRLNFAAFMKRDCMKNPTDGLMIALWTG